MERKVYGTTRDGRQVESFTLCNTHGLEVRCLNYGCRLTHILVPGKSGKTDILLGFDTLAQYEADATCQGALIGRFAGRIAGAGFSLGGTRYALTQNDGPNFLHGSFHHRVFEASAPGEGSVCFTATSPEGEDGFPGEVQLAVTYTLTDENELVMEYRAVPSAATHLNLTGHSYFNLAGPGGSMVDQTLLLNCDRFLELGEGLLPTGRVAEAASGAFDFLDPKPIGQDIDAPDPQLRLAGGYDHCFVINRQRPTMLAHAATAQHPASGRTLRVYTTQPGVVLYTGNGLDGTPGKNGAPLARRSGFCLETQHFPDSPNRPDFPPTLVEAGEKYHHISVLQFEW